MKIVILGAGKVGTSIIENFIDEEPDIVIIDSDEDKLASIANKYDLLTIKGSATDIETLDRAGLGSANLLIAVTNSDDTNIIACKIANDLYNVEIKIARLRGQSYLAHKDELFNNNIFPIDYVIEPTLIMAQSMYNLINYPGVLSFTSFANDSCALFTCEAQYGGSMIGKAALGCFSDLKELNIALVGIVRNNFMIAINESTIINAGDKIVMMASLDAVTLGVSKFQRLLPKPKRIILAGGSKINYYLATLLADSARVKIIEKNASRADVISSSLRNVLVLTGDCADENLLYDERIDSTDLFVAATNQDNVNVLTSVLAKRLGAKRAICLTGRSGTSSLIHNEEVDIFYSGKRDIAMELISQAKLTNFIRTVKDSQGLYQVSEFAVIPNLKSIELVGTPYGELKLPGKMRFLGYLREEEFFVIDDSTVLKEGDHVFALYTDSSQVEDFAKLNTKAPDFV